ncbi:MAG: 4Fe-4S dicluster domain-containing protein [Armatimonadia bacterium]
MTLQVISVAEIRGLLAQLMEQGRVVAPHKRPGDRQWAFEDLTDPADAVLQYTTTIIPAKKYAFPPKETLLRYELGQAPSVTAVVDSEPLVLFGVHTCDLYGLTALDTAFADHFADANYLEKRAKMRIIGIECVPDEWCFCASMGTATIDSGYELFLTPLPDEEHYIVEVGSDAGDEMLKGIASREATAGEVSYLKTHLNRKITQERHLDSDYTALPLLFTGFAESPVWEKWAEKCYGCGTCNLTCPTCFCWDVLDEMGLALTTGERRREWDGCMLEGFARVATGENFRENRTERLRHRFFRKYAYLFTRYGKPYCCGCGRCVRQCLVKIDPVGVINELIAAHGKGGALIG